MEGVFKKYGDRTAVICDGKEYSFTELEERTKSIAAFLRENGITNNTAAAIMLKKGFPQIVAVLGINYSGGAYAPIEYDLPLERVKDSLIQAGAKVLITVNQDRKSVV